MSDTFHVLVVDDQPIFRSGLRTMIEEATDLEWAGEAPNGAEAVDAYRALRPDVVLMDVRMPEMGGLEATRLLVAEDRDASVLMLTMLEDDTSVFAAMRAGARGYVLKGAEPDEIVRAIVSVARGGAVFGSSIAARMTAFFQADVAHRITVYPALSQREHDILEHIARGESNGEIAGNLGLSEKTIRNNVSAILAKLHVRDRSEAIVQAREAGMGHQPA